MQIILLALLVITSGCQSRTTLAPVEEIRWNSPSIPWQYKVRRGETLYTIAFRYEKDYRELAKLNNLSYPYKLYVNQVIILKPRNAPKGILTKAIKAPKKVANSHWAAPIRGRILNNFNLKFNQKGVNFVASPNEKVHAVADGTVAYSGNGISGYGELIIIKHNNKLLTAYGHNFKNFVKEGDKVTKGQVIAQVGKIDKNRFGLHFEVRDKGQPINPLLYL